MSNGVKELRSLPLFEIIGAPMIAIVQAQAQAARATIEFIEKVGFNQEEQTGEPGLKVGELRMAEFSYTKLDENREPAAFVARVPVLSLVSIPGIQVKNAKISFTAKITDAVAEPTASTQSPRSAAPAQPAWLRPSLTSFRGSLAPAPRPADKEAPARGNFEMNIEVELEQMPIAPGLEKILNLMDQAISESKTGTAKREEAVISAPVASPQPRPAPREAAKKRPERRRR
jgi:hypothetical protein